MGRIKVNKTLWILLTLFIVFVAVLCLGIKYQSHKTKEVTAININIEAINDERANKDRLLEEKIKWINQYIENENIDQPKKEMTEAEFFVLLSKAYGVSPTVTDTSEYWAAGYYQKAVEEYKYKSLDVKQSNKKINHLRAAEIVNMVLGEKNKGNDSINFLNQSGFNDLFDQNALYNNVTRKEGIEIIKRTLENGFYTFQELNENNKRTFIFLGDSISLGWNADTNSPKHMPTKYGFPYIIGNQYENFHIVNLASRGATTGNLLNDLDNPIYQSKIRKSDLICIDIGSVDLLGAANDFLEKVRSGNGALPTVKQISAIQDAANQAMINLDNIVETIRNNTNSPIYIVGLYNPIPAGTTGDEFGDLIIKKINKHYENIAMKNKSVMYIDSFSTFNGKESDYVISGEIHPTYEGQKVLATLLSEELPKE
ncbi:SGNH/GDSL hydrolase family protein [Niallia taxi]|uniref:SGNH hydrolase-type esterase domain-containing protein n=1 Tax=Niallia taxi TaxID=2499688 RepID=A0A437KCT7_9BACI|nr:GDSL-type esterase/lipase family protein [Niallia taxi]RVT63859.1 hypothetical protein EM808_11435 [Niallia taxi]